MNDWVTKAIRRYVNEIDRQLFALVEGASADGVTLHEYPRYLLIMREGGVIGIVNKTTWALNDGKLSTSLFGPVHLETDP